MVGWLVHACNGNDCNYRTLPLTLSVVLLLLSLLFTHLEWFKLLPMINQNSALILRFLFPRCVCVCVDGPREECAWPHRIGIAVDHSMFARNKFESSRTLRCLLTHGFHY